MREREQQFGSFEIWFFVLWEVGVVILRSVNMTLILTSKRNIRNMRASCSFYIWPRLIHVYV